MNAGFLAAFRIFRERYPLKSDKELLAAMGIDNTEYSNVKSGIRNVTDAMVIKFSKYAKLSQEQIMAYADHPLEQDASNLKQQLEVIKKENDFLKTQVADKDFAITEMRRSITLLSAEVERLKRGGGSGGISRMA